MKKTQRDFLLATFLGMLMLVGLWLTVSLNAVRARESEQMILVSLVASESLEAGKSGTIGIK